MQCPRLRNIILYNRLKILFVQIILLEGVPISSKFSLSIILGIEELHHHIGRDHIGSRYRNELIRKI